MTRGIGSSSRTGVDRTDITMDVRRFPAIRPRPPGVRTVSVGPIRSADTSIQRRKELEVTLDSTIRGADFLIAVVTDAIDMGWKTARPTTRTPGNVTRMFCSIRCSSSVDRPRRYTAAPDDSACDSILTIV